MDLRPQGKQQGELNLFGGDGAQARLDRPRLLGAMNALNQRFGRGAVMVTSAVHQDQHRAHTARQERRSPRYTMRLEEIATTRGVVPIGGNDDGAAARIMAVHLRKPPSGSE